MRSRSAFSLPEIMIASTILVVVFGMVVTVLVSTNQHEASSATQDDVAESAEKIRRMITADLSLSGWHVPDGTTSDPDGDAGPLLGYSALETAGADAGRLTRVLAADRQRRYYPYVIGTGTGQGPLGAIESRENPTFFAHAQIAPALRVDTLRLGAAMSATMAPGADIDALGATAAAVRSFFASYTAPSQSLIYLRAFTYDGQNVLVADPIAGPTAQERQNYERYLALGASDRGDLPQDRFTRPDNSDLALWTSPGNHAAIGVLFPSPVAENATSGAWTVRSGIAVSATGAQLEAYGRPFEAGYLVTGSDGTVRIQPQWETVDMPTHRRPLDEEVWRERMLTVVRSPRGGFHGRLVRASKLLRTTPARPTGSGLGQSITDPAVPGQWEFVVDRVISDSVARVVFDTYRTERFASTDQPRLDINHVRVRVYLTRPDFAVRSTQQRVLSFIVTMRAKNTEAQRADDALVLGTESPGFPR